eukprot:scaffold904_cov81-Skeletonema_dohrnii-CCMP3373.AAC.3
MSEKQKRRLPTKEETPAGPINAENKLRPSLRSYVCVLYLPGRKNDEHYLKPQTMVAERFAKAYPSEGFGKGRYPGDDDE